MVDHTEHYGYRGLDAVLGWNVECRGSLRKFRGGGTIVTYREIERGDGFVWDENLINL